MKSANQLVGTPIDGNLQMMMNLTRFWETLGCLNLCLLGIMGTAPGKFWGIHRTIVAIGVLYLCPFRLTNWYGKLR